MDTTKTTHKFSGAVISSLILEPIKYFFTNYAGQYGFTYSDDPKISTLEIGYVSDFNRITQGVNPRILIDRGDYSVTKGGLSDNMRKMTPYTQNGGLTQKESMVFCQGNAQLYINARNLGTVEALADLVSHLIVDTRPTICNLGFLEFGLPLQVSRPQLNTSEGDTETFTIAINIPWVREDTWKTWNDSVKIKGILREIVTGLPS